METKTKKSKKIKIAVGLAIVAFLIIFYVSGMMIFAQRFYPNTTVNGIDVGLKNVDEVKELLHADADGYVLTLVEREKQTETISGADIDLVINTDHDEPLTNLLIAQDSRLWFVHVFRAVSAISMETPVEYDEEKLDAVIDGLTMMNPDTFKEPINATVSDYEEGQPYTIVPEYVGTKTKMKPTRRLIHEALYDMPEEFDLDANDCYHAPEITAETPELISVVEDMNKYIDTEIKIKIGKKTETIDAKLTHKWLKVDLKKMTVQMDFSHVQKYVAKLKKKYDTIYTKRKFKTHDGRKISITSGFYGWQMDQDATANKIIEKLDKFKSKEIKPIWTQEAASYNRKNDWGKTYVEIDMGQQVLFFYKNGKKKLESNVVTGCVANGHATPEGIYPITYKTTHQRMVGADYNVLAYYWMPFNGDIGIHDATWRGYFGGSQYYYGGSHGCVNMPYSNAEILYGMVEKDMPVICYY